MRVVAPDPHSHLYDDIPAPLAQLSHAVIGAAIDVHRSLGPGLLERPYKVLLAHRLRTRGFAVETEVPIAITVDGLTFDVAYRADMIIEGTLLAELKAVAEIHDIHVAQTKTYLRLGGFPLGLILNFHAPSMRMGVKRIVP